jgi:hypothetical protein
MKTNNWLTGSVLTFLIVAGVAIIALRHGSRIQAHD